MLQGSGNHYIHPFEAVDGAMAYDGVEVPLWIHIHPHPREPEAVQDAQHYVAMPTNP